jgi:hypothetical protein
MLLHPGVKSSKGKRVGNNNNSTPSTWQIRYREVPHDQKDKELLSTDMGSFHLIRGHNVYMLAEEFLPYILPVLVK